MKKSNNEHTEDSARYIFDSKGNVVQVVLDVSLYETLMEIVEQSEDALLGKLAELRLATDDKLIPYEEVRKKLDAHHGLTPEEIASIDEE